MRVPVLLALACGLAPIAAAVVPSPDGAACDALGLACERWSRAYGALGTRGAARGVAVSEAGDATFVAGFTGNRSLLVGGRAYLATEGSAVGAIASVPALVTHSFDASDGRLRWTSRVGDLGGEFVCSAQAPECYWGVHVIAHAKNGAFVAGEGDVVAQEGTRMLLAALER